VKRAGLIAAGLLALAVGGCAGRVQVAAPTPVPAPPLPPLEVQVIGFNDFHGNLLAPAAPVKLVGSDGATRELRLGGAEAMAATVRQLRQGQAHSITVSAGDMIGASPLVSAYYLDEPTIQVMDALGLSLNAVGNHEFDRGTAELQRMQKGGCDTHTTRKPCALEPFDGAQFAFLAANVRSEAGGTLFPGAVLRSFGPVQIGFIGMTLKDTEFLVSPAGVAGVRFEEEAASANALVPQLLAQGADTVVLLIHQGGETPATFRQQGCEGLAGPILGILDGLHPAIRTIVSGHTHNAYACEIERGGTPRLLTSAGRYGMLVTDIRLRFDPASGAFVGGEAANVPVLPDAGAEPAVAAIVSRYAAAAEPAAARVVGRLRGEAPIREDRRESVVANLVADAQLAWTRPAARGGAELAFINGGGVRRGIVPGPGGAVTFGQVFDVQPFGNTIVVKRLSGAELKALLEQQFVERPDGTVGMPAPLIPSNNVRFAFDRSRPAGQRILSVSVNGRTVRPERSYRVTVNNFLASGGDGYSVLKDKPTLFDAGPDIDALEAYLARNPAAPRLGRTADRTPG
jgi:5'-nucleotidase